MKCRHCDSEATVKDEHNPSGSAKYYCNYCKRNFTLQPKPHGYDLATREKAVKMYVDGVYYRRAGRVLNVSHQSVVNWVTQAADQVKPETAVRPAMDEETIVALDELFIFVGAKKTKPTSSRKSTGKRAAL